MAALTSPEKRIDQLQLPSVPYLRYSQVPRYLVQHLEIVSALPTGAATWGFTGELVQEEAAMRPLEP